MKRSIDRSRMRGISLVEVMVSIVIGMVVVGAVLVSYLSSGKTTRQQAAYAEMHENAQMALTLLSRDLLLAGYAQVTGAPDPVAPATTSTFTRTYSGRAVFGCDGNFDSPTKKAPLGDVVCAIPAVGKPSLEVSYEADVKNTVPVPVSGSPDSPSDCKGSQIRPAAGTLSGVDYFIVHNRFFIKTGASGASELYCGSSTQSASGAAVSDEPLVDNVDNMKIWYGEANAANTRQIVRYVSAGNVSDWTRIVSVRICLLMRSAEPVSDIELTATPKFLDCDSVQQNLPDRYLRRAYFTTTTLRNKMAF
jgi:type IV pilus assembly protein PilW